MKLYAHIIRLSCHKDFAINPHLPSLLTLWTTIKMQSTGCCSTKKKRWTIVSEVHSSIEWIFALHWCVSLIYFFRSCSAAVSDISCTINLLAPLFCFLILKNLARKLCAEQNNIYEESWSELITIVKSQITQSARRRRRTMTATEVQHVFKGSAMELWGELLLLQLTFQCLHFSVCFSVLVCRRALSRLGVFIIIIIITFSVTTREICTFNSFTPWHQIRCAVKSSKSKAVVRQLTIMCEL